MSLRDLTQTAWGMQDLVAQGGDTGELTYGVLGTLIDEANALHILYRASFMRRLWGVDTSDYLREVSPALGRHPYRPLILTFLFRKGSRGETIDRLAAAFEPSYINPLNLRVFTYHLDNGLRFAGGMTESEWWTRARWMEWMSGTDWLSEMRWYHGENLHERGENAARMTAFDPHHPRRIALRIQHANIKPAQLERLTRKYGHHAEVANALAQHIFEQGDLQSAREYAELASIAAPERTTLERLARLELLLGDEVKWLAAMKLILQLPDHGLDHARINQIIAHTYMNQGRFEEALPYSKASADSWAAWAMQTYIINLAAVGRHQEAKAIGRRVNERYGQGYQAAESAQMWAGQGDPEQLIRSIERTYRQQFGNKPADYGWRMLYIEVALGRFEQALERVDEVIVNQATSTRALLFGVVAAQHLGEEKKRDQLLQQLVEYPPKNGERYRFSLLGDIMKQGLETGRVDWQAAAKWTQLHDSELRIEVASNLSLFALKLPAERERAEAQLLALSKRPQYDSDLTNMARAVLRAMGYTYEQLAPTGFVGHPFPQAGLD